MIETDLYINGGSYFGFGILGAILLLLAGIITWATADTNAVGRGVGIPLLVAGVLLLPTSITLATVTHDGAYNAVVKQIHEQGYTDPVDINGKTFTTGERWCALKPINGDDATIFKIICEPAK